MESNKLQDIIRDKNQQRERQTLNTAEQIIEEIVSHQGKISYSAKQIEALRKQLVELEVPVLDSKTVLGE